MKQTILVVDDNVINRMILKTALQEEYQILQVADGRAALSVLELQWPHICAVLTDVAMPEMDGYALLREIRNTPPFSTMPVIMVTGMETEDSRSKALTLGANDFLVKPCDPAVIRHCVRNAVALHMATSALKDLRRDKLTGLYTRESFFEEAKSLCNAHEPGYYILSCVDVENFKVINEQYGTETGDQVLIRIADQLKEAIGKTGGICCRHTADRFATLYPSAFKDTLNFREVSGSVIRTNNLDHRIKIRIGRYLVTDLSLSVSAMYDRAVLAEESIRNRYDKDVAEFDETMRNHLVIEQRIVNNMTEALANGEFEPWFQPQFNHATGAMIGAEALVRWKRDGTYVPPSEFVPVFERNGFIYEMDKSVWKQVCSLLRKWRDAGLDPLPVSVNVSRRDLFHPECVDFLKSLPKDYGLPIELLRLEVTESAFSENSSLIVSKVSDLISFGFTVEIDDFGSGFSSLNTLKDVPAAILKLDMRFFEETQNQQRGGNIISSVVRMAKWLGMAIIAEGVEDKAQADFLKTIGCYYIQGYFYAKPMPSGKYEKLFTDVLTERRLSRLQTLETLDNNEFWNPKSMETLIFNSYVGGACIFEVIQGKNELLRMNDRYTKEFNGLLPEDVQLMDASMVQFLNSDGKERLHKIIENAVASKTEVTDEVCLTNGKQTEYLRITARVIARNGDRALLYSVVFNNTKQREAEKKQLESAHRLNAIMSNINGGVSAIIINADASSRIVFCNEKYYDLYGCKREEAAARKLDVMTLIVPEDLPGVMKQVAEIQECGQPQVIDYRVRRLDGRLSYLRANVSLLHMDGIGNVLISVITDITEKRLLEEQLQAVVNNIFGGVSASVLSKDRAEFLIMNDMFAQIHGFPDRASFEAYNRQERYASVHPEDRERVRALYENATRHAGNKLTCEYRIIRRDGCIRNIHCNVSVINMFGYDDPVHLTVLLDVTDRVAAQNREHELSTRLNTIMSNVRGGITSTKICKDGSIRFLYANDGFFGLYGYTRSQWDAEVKSLTDPILPEDREKVLQILSGIMRDGGSGTGEYRCRKRDGSVIWVLSTNTLVGVEDGEYRFLAVTTETTKLHRIEEERNRAAERLNAIINRLPNGLSAVAFYPDHIEHILANDRFYEMQGLQKEDYVHSDLERSLQIIHPDDVDRVRCVIKKAAETGERTLLEYRVVRTDGITRWFKSVINPVRLLGVDAPVQITMYEDITAEKEAADQLRFLNDSAHDILAQPDSERAINQSLENLMNYFSGNRSYIFELQPDGKTSDNTYECCAEGVESEIALLRNTPYSTTRYWFEAFERGEIIAIPDVASIDEAHAEMREILTLQNIRSLIVVPLRRDGKVIGFVGVDDPKRAVDQVHQLVAIGDYLTVLLTRRDLMLRIQKDTAMSRQMLEDIPGGYVRYSVSEDGNITTAYLNDNYCRMRGMRREELLAAEGKDALVSMHPEDRAEVRKQAEEALLDEQERTVTLNYRLLCGSGSYRWFSALIRKLVSVHQHPYLVAYYTDITEKKTAEQQQIELLDNLPNGAALYSYDGTTLGIIHINQRYWDLVGLKPGEGIFRSASDAVHPDDRMLVKQEVDSAIRQNRTIELNIRVLCGAGTYKPFHISATVSRLPDGTYQLYASFVPISEDRMSVQEIFPIALSTMMSSSEDLSYVTDHDFRYLCCSKSNAAFLGLADEQEIAGKTDYDLFTPDVAAQMMEDSRRVMETGVPLIDKEQRITSHTGKVRYVTISKYPIKDGAGNNVGLYGVSRDITEQKEKESQLQLLSRSIPGGLASFRCYRDHISTLFFNDGLRELSGYTAGDFAGKNIDPISFVYEEDRDALMTQLHALIHDSTPIDCNVRIHTLSGGYLWLNSKAVETSRDEDSVTVSAVITDITEQQEEKEQLRQSEEFNRLAMQLSGKIITRFDVSTRTLTLPEHLSSIYEVSHILYKVPEEQIRLGRISPETADTYRNAFSDILSGKRSGSFVYQQHSTLGWRWLESQFTTVFTASNKPAYAVVSFTDITEQREKEAAYDKWINSIQSRAPDSYTLFRCNITRGVSFDSCEGSLLDIRFRDTNASFNQLTQEFVRQKVYREDASAFTSVINGDLMLAEYYRGHRSSTIEFREMCTDGSLRWLRLSVDLVEYPDSKDVEAYLMFENIDEEKRNALLTAERAETDPLTGILNRTTFADRMSKHIADSGKNAIHAFLMLDIDDFKGINDSFGHSTGDQALVALAEYLKTVCRPDDLVARLGGDEFVIFLPDLSDRNVAVNRAQQICRFSYRPASVAFSVTSSVGIAFCPNDGTDFDSLYQAADKALYQVKEAGKGSYRVSGDNSSSEKGPLSNASPEVSAP